jgi:hypothetical protein
MRITEPTTMLTDYALAALCLYFAAALWRGSRPAGGRRVGLWIAAFLVTAFAAFAGGTAHGFRLLLGDRWDSVWAVTVWSIVASSILLISSGVRSVLHSQARDATQRSEGIRWLKRAIVISLAGLAVLIAKLSIHEHFNKNDLYHLIQMGGLYCLYRGALLLHNLARAD